MTHTKLFLRFVLTHLLLCNLEGLYLEDCKQGTRIGPMVLPSNKGLYLVRRASRTLNQDSQSVQNLGIGRNCLR